MASSAFFALMDFGFRGRFQIGCQSVGGAYASARFWAASFSRAATGSILGSAGVVVVMRLTRWVVSGPARAGQAGGHSAAGPPRTREGAAGGISFPDAGL
ncbi:hypothetical protein [Streptomyces sp. NRRL F-2664]|uniref:hypothetical protein n=1 Tax=Streptomyces sp. NRRL F-2664 TaxID=1463842 RepID=UPI000A95E44C|nr:hypothetical protein [Streptomyces sp. NRRL F-2664]